MGSERFRFGGRTLAAVNCLVTFVSGLWFSLPGFPLAGLGANHGQALAAASQAYTPPAGSAERRAIVEALRQKLRSLHQVEAIFEVHYLKVHRGWAWIEASPRSPDGRQRYEPVSALLREEGGRWQVAEFPCTEEDNPDCLGQPGYFQKLRARFPAAPRDIFPQ